MEIRKRHRINENIDENLLQQLDYLSKELDFPKSRIVEVGIKHVLNKQLVPIEKSAKRKPINLTINSSLWSNLKIYSETNNYKIVHLIELGLKYSLKKYKKEIHDIN